MDTTHQDVLTQQTKPEREQATGASAEFSFLWLEITRKCNLTCVHCYAESSPSATSGRMSREMWQSVIDQAHRIGVKQVQFIGGEPTIHRHFPDLLISAAHRNMEIEVYSNLTHISPTLWDLFKRFKVSLATSFYSIHPEIHNEITQGRSHAKTVTNIKEALERGIDLRVGLIDVLPRQELPETIGMLRNLGVRNIRVDRSRGVGRAQPQDSQCNVNELCGKCGYGKAAIDCDGDVFPCVFSRWLSVGNVLSKSLRDVLHGKQMQETQKYLDAQFTARYKAPSQCSPRHEPASDCVPDCNPTCSPCSPSPCSPDCTPNCGPNCSPLCTPSCGPSCSPQCAPRNE